MSEVDVDGVLGELTNEYVSARPVNSGSEDSHRVPARWQPILVAEESQERCRIALSLWREDFLGALPRFARLFKEQLTDVLVFWLRGGLDGAEGQIVLVYVAGHDYEDRPVLWIGWDPATFGDADPPFFDAVPEPARAFLRETHAGFTAEDFESYGIMRPTFLQTLAQRAGWTADDLGGEQLRLARELVLTKDSGALFYCVSPDLPAGKITLLYEGNYDPPEDFGPALDGLMAGRWNPWAVDE